MAAIMEKWPSRQGQLTKIRLPDGCGGKTITMVAQSGYGKHGSEGYLGNVAFMTLKQLIKRIVPKPIWSKLHLVRQSFRRKTSLLRRAASRKLGSGVNDAQRLEVMVVSPGGVGTTMLLRYLSGFVKTNMEYDQDGLKHLPFPPWKARQLAELPKVIFVTGSFSDIYDSMRRRSFVKIQGAKLGSVLTVLFPGNTKRLAFRKAVRAQERKWRSAPGLELMVISYEELWERTAEIAAFIGVDKDKFVKNFPKKRARSQSELRRYGDVRKLILRPAGMFSNVNELVEQLRLAEVGGTAS